MSSNYKTQTERTHDLLLDRATAAETRAVKAESIAAEAILSVEKALEERDAAVKALETLRNGLKAAGRNNIGPASA